MISANVIADMIGAITGGTSDIAKLGIKIIEAPFDIRNKFFWDNFKYFIDNIYLTDEEKDKLRDKLVVNGDYDNVKRIIYNIYNIDIKKKVDYIIYATRSLLDEKITSTDYFRICNAITIIIYEDLIYLKENIDKKNLHYDMTVQALMNVGVVTRDQIPAESAYNYMFTPFAKQLYENAICPEDHHLIDIKEPSHSMMYKEVSEEDIRDLFERK